jgi:hypothetical protein
MPQYSTHRNIPIPCIHYVCLMMHERAALRAAVICVGSSIESSFWLWFEHSSFAFYGGTGSRGCPGGPGTLPCDWGQRPTVILRGAPRCSGPPRPECPAGPRSRGMKSSGLVEEVYLVRFEKIIFGGGGVQYQQMSNESSTAGWFDFVSCTQVGGWPTLPVQVSLAQFLFGRRLLPCLSSTCKVLPTSPTAFQACRIF